VWYNRVNQSKGEREMLNQSDRKQIKKDREMNKDQTQEYIESRLTDKDIRKWHQGKMTKHVEKLMKETGADEIEIWGSRKGPEPLSVIVRF
jgi:hypothetical protein